MLLIRLNKRSFTDKNMQKNTLFPTENAKKRVISLQLTISLLFTLKISVHHNFVSEEVARLAGGGVPFGQRTGVGDHDADCLNV